MGAQIYRKPLIPQPQRELAAMDRARVAKAAFSRRMRDDLEDVQPVTYRIEQDGKTLAKKVWELMKAKTSRMAVCSVCMLTSAISTASYFDFRDGGTGLFSPIFGKLDSPAIPYVFGSVSVAVATIYFVLEFRNGRMATQAANWQAK